jgi:hypothetical protein
MYPLQVIPYPRPNLVYSIGTQSEIGAIFPFYAQKMIDDGLAISSVLSEKSKEEKGLSFSRSAWLGSQRFSSVLWNGDVDGSWESFRSQIAAGLNVQVSGMEKLESRGQLTFIYSLLEFHGGHPTLAATMLKQDTVGTYPIRDTKSFIFDGFNTERMTSEYPY